MVSLISLERMALIVCSLFLVRISYCTTCLEAYKLLHCFVYQFITFGLKVRKKGAAISEIFKSKVLIFELVQYK